MQSFYKLALYTLILAQTALITAPTDEAEETLKPSSILACGGCRK